MHNHPKSIKVAPRELYEAELTPEETAPRNFDGKAAHEAPAKTAPKVTRRVPEDGARFRHRTFPKTTVVGTVEEAVIPKVRHLRAVRTRTPTTVNGKVAPPVRVKNLDRRTREHLTPSEVEKLMAGAGRP